jgi:hypothetical protein
VCTPVVGILSFNEGCILLVLVVLRVVLRGIEDASCWVGIGGSYVFISLVIVVLVDPRSTVVLDRSKDLRIL